MYPRESKFVYITDNVFTIPVAIVTNELPKRHDSSFTNGKSWLS